MPSIYDIYERKNYRNKIPLNQAISFEVEVRETNLHIQANSDLSAKAKDAVFRYRYQIEEYLRQHPAFREATSPIQIYASAPDIARYADMAGRLTGIPPMMCMSGALADFVGRDLYLDSSSIVVSSGGDAFIHTHQPVTVQLYALGSPIHNKLILVLPAYKKIFGISTYAPGHGIHAVTVVSRSASWASSFATDIGTRLKQGEPLSSVLNRAEQFKDVGGIIVIKGNRVIVGGEIVLRSLDGKVVPPSDQSEPSVGDE